MTQVLEASSPVTIQAVTTPEQREQFLDVPQLVYANDPNWVQPLRSSIAGQLAPDSGFLEYGSFQPFIALQTVEGKTRAVGRIVAAVNRRLIEREGQPIGLFGYFECINDDAIAQALINAACQWLKDQGMTTVRGPIDLSTHNNCLLLVDGFDSRPYIMMPYNPAYYVPFFEEHGWHKAKDAYAYIRNVDDSLPEEFEKGYRIACKSGIHFRQLRLKGDEFIDDCRQLYHLFNTAFSNNWSSTPRTEAEFLEEAKSLQSLVDPEIFWIAEYEGKMVGFFMALPDYNIALKHVNGRLNWLGILKFLWYRRKIDRARIIAICSLPEHRRRMVPLGLIYLTMQKKEKSKRVYRQVEMSWVYEDNMPSRKVIEASGTEIYKTYRIYEKALT